MKVFISWSGERSRAVAKALCDWLPKVIQAVKPFYSPEIEKGAKWSNEIDGALDGTSFGIVCLTPDNLESKWIHFESGALSKTPNAKIWTYLHGIKNEDVPPPLSKFQHTLAEKLETLALIKSINSNLKEAAGEPLKEDFLITMFETFWTSLEEKLKEAETFSNKSKIIFDSSLNFQRDERAILSEVLEIVRNQQHQIDKLNVNFKNAMSKTPYIPSQSKFNFFVDDSERVEVSVSLREELSLDNVIEIAELITKAKIGLINTKPYQINGDFFLDLIFDRPVELRSLKKLLKDNLPDSITELIETIK